MHDKVHYRRFLLTIIGACCNKDYPGSVVDPSLTIRIALVGNKHPLWDSEVATTTMVTLVLSKAVGVRAQKYG